MIGLAMEKWPDDALRRVVDAPVETWAEGSPEWIADEGGPKPAAGCLLHIAGSEGMDWHDAGKTYVGHSYGPVGERFDALAFRFGIPRTVRALKKRALAILLKRHPLDSRLVVLRAGLKTGV